MASYGYAAPNDAVIKYVKAGASGLHNGSKANPYATLAEAQGDLSWDVLMVLASEQVLDGGISLRPGTKLIGSGRNPTKQPLTHDQPTITNSSGATNFGCCIIANGDNTIENIYLESPWYAAILYDNAENLKVKDVLIDGHTTGSGSAGGAIQGTPLHNGKTVLKNVIVKNNYSEALLYEQLTNGLVRELVIDECEFANPFQPNSGILTGVIAFATGGGTRSTVVVKNSTFHDFTAGTYPFPNSALWLQPTNGGKLTATICNTTFDNINGNNATGCNVIYAQPSTDTNVLPQSELSRINLQVTNCSFNELPGNQAKAVSLVSVFSNDTVTFEECKVTGLLDTFKTVIGTYGTQKISLKENTITGGGGYFFEATTYDVGLPFDGPQQVVADIELERNTYSGSANMGFPVGAIVVYPSSNGTCPWSDFTLEARENCFDGQGTGLYGIFMLDGSGSTGAGNAVLNLHRNSFVGYQTDIFNACDNIECYAQENWWGEEPITVENNNPNTSIIDVSSPLERPHRCITF